MADNIEDDFFNTDIQTISYRDNFDLLQRHKKVLKLNPILIYPNENLIKLHTLFVSGYITDSRYRRVAPNVRNNDIQYSNFYDAINSEHKKRTDETLIPVKIRNERELRYTLNKLKKNYFTILMYKGKFEFGWEEDNIAMSCLILNNDGVLEVISFNGERPPIETSLDDFLNEDNIMNEMVVLGIVGREKQKRELQNSILHLSTRYNPRPEFPVFFSKDIYNYIKGEYSPKRKNNKK